MKLRAILVALCLTLTICNIANAKGPRHRMHRCQVHWFADCEASFGPQSGKTICPVIFGESTTRLPSCTANLDSNKIFSQKPFPQRNSLPQFINGQWISASVSVKNCPAGTFTDCTDVLCNIPNPDSSFLLATCGCHEEDAQWGFVTSAHTCDGSPVGVPLLKK
jgi:hypothetical protein